MGQSRARLHSELRRELRPSGRFQTLQGSDSQRAVALSHAVPQLLCAGQAAVPSCPRRNARCGPSLSPIPASRCSRLPPSPAPLATPRRPTCPTPPTARRATRSCREPYVVTDPFPEGRGLTPAVRELPTEKSSSRPPPRCPVCARPLASENDMAHGGRRLTPVR